MSTLQVNLPQELIDALLRVPEEIAGLKKHLNEVLEENQNLKLGLQHYTVEETGKLSKVSKTTLENWEQREMFVPIRIGGKKLYSDRAILDLSRYQSLQISTPEEDWRPSLVRKLHRENQDQIAA
ncbi:MerR family transcriptional regulator [Larkinella bovis]|uniref:MerR family transcriptional regulator n=1 Tax=Larkinella bovis TaxID=683041 RepID=A0ABW0I6S9_9BACT